MDDAAGLHDGQPVIEIWEMDLVRQVAKTIRAADPAELESDLMLQLPEIKRRYKPNVRYWRTYLKKALRSRAFNWLRDRRRRKVIDMIELDAPLGETESRTRADIEPAADEPVELSPNFAAAWQALSPKLQDFCIVMDEENGNLTRVGMRLKLHRNTVRSWKYQVAQIFRRHGL